LGITWTITIINGFSYVVVLMGFRCSIESANISPTHLPLSLLSSFFFQLQVLIITTLRSINSRQLHGGCPRALQHLHFLQHLRPVLRVAQFRVLLHEHVYSPTPTTVFFSLPRELRISLYDFIWCSSCNLTIVRGPLKIEASHSDHSFHGPRQDGLPVWLRSKE
jgi:hypothetical protein